MSMDAGRIVRIVAVAFAVVAGLVAIPQSAVIIAVLGLAGGFFVPEDHSMNEERAEHISARNKKKEKRIEI